MEPSIPPENILDPDQPWYKGRVRDENWKILKSKLTGGSYDGTTYSSFVNLTNEEADELIKNLKKDPRGYPQLNTVGGYIGEEYRKEYQEWLVREYLHKELSSGSQSKEIEESQTPKQSSIDTDEEDYEVDEDSKELDNILDLIREKEEEDPEDDEEPEDLDELIKSISEEKVQKAKAFLSQPTARKKTKLNKIKTSGIIPKKSIPDENVSRIIKPPENVEEKPKREYKKSLESSLTKLSSDLEIVNSNLLKIKKIISDDYKGRKKTSNKELEDTKKRVANRGRFFGKKDSKDSKSDSLGPIKKYAGTFFSGVGGAIRAISAFSLLEALFSGDPSKLIGPIVAIGLSYLPAIGAGIAGAIITSLTKQLVKIKGIPNLLPKDQAKNLKPLDVDAPKTSTPKPPKPSSKKSLLGNIGKLLNPLRQNKVAKIGGKAALIGGGVALLSGVMSGAKGATTSSENAADHLHDDYQDEEKPKDEQEERLRELTEQQKKLVDPKNLVSITQDDLSRFEKLNKKFEEALDFLIKIQKEQAAKGGRSGGGGGGGAAPSSPGTMNVSNDGSASGMSALSGTEQEKIEKLLAAYEGFRANAYIDDVGVPTIGFGQTRINGRAVRMGDVMTLEQAMEGKKQNIESHRNVAIKQIGKVNWEKLDENVRVSLTSIAYNYGSIPDSVMGAVKTGNSESIAKAIEGLSGDDGGINAWRRKDEAMFIRTGKSSRVTIPTNLSSNVPNNIKPNRSKPKPSSQVVASANTGSSGGSVVASRPNQRTLSPVASKPSVTVVPMSVAQATPQERSSATTSGNDNIPNVRTSYPDNIFATYSKSLYQVI
jgi:GH24 family phage-related lysozyme (muramidase)